VPTQFGKTREFNVISNEFTDNPKERRQQEYDHVKNRVLQKYWETHDLNLLTGEYYEEGKQQRFEAQRKLVSSVQGTAAMQKLPPAYKFSDGNSYNILNHSVYDETQFKATNTVANKSLNKIKRIQVEKKWHDEGEVKGDIQSKRSINRISFERFKGEIDRGFDPIKNSLYEGAEPDPLPIRPPTNWARLTSSSNNNNQFGDTGDYHGEYIQQPPRSTRNLSGAGGQNGTGRMVQSAAAPLGSPVGLEAQESFLASTTSRSYRENTARSNNQQPTSGRPRPGASARQAEQYGDAPTPSSGNNSNRNIARPATTQQPSYSQRGGSGHGSGPGGGRGGGMSVTRSVPSLNLAAAEQAEMVTYQEPQGAGPKGAVVPIIRTGGLSGY
jgi:hypothetical protein